jgi:hypothetical protein
MSQIDNNKSTVTVFNETEIEKQYRNPKSFGYPFKLKNIERCPKCNCSLSRVYRYKISPDHFSEDRICAGCNFPIGYWSWSNTREDREWICEMDGIDEMYRLNEEKKVLGKGFLVSYELLPKFGIEEGRLFRDSHNNKEVK